MHCQKCGAVPEKKENLPVSLPENVSFENPGNPLESAYEWLNVKCPICTNPAKRETDTMDTFVDSSWYFIRFTSPKHDRPTKADDLSFSNSKLLIII